MVYPFAISECVSQINSTRVGLYSVQFSNTVEIIIASKLLTVARLSSLKSFRFAGGSCAVVLGLEGFGVAWSGCDLDLLVASTSLKKKAR